MNFFYNMFSFHSSFIPFENQLDLSARGKKNDIYQTLYSCTSSKLFCFYIYDIRGYQNFRFDFLRHNLTFLHYWRTTWRKVYVVISNVYDGKTFFLGYIYNENKWRYYKKNIIGRLNDLFEIWWWYSVLSEWNLVWTTIILA